MQRVRNYKTKRIEYRSFLFDKIDIQKGIAIPNERFWELWNSEKREAVIRAGILPIKHPETQCWFVLIGRNTTITVPIKEILSDVSDDFFS